MTALRVCADCGKSTKTAGNETKRCINCWVVHSDKLEKVSENTKMIVIASNAYEQGIMARGNETHILEQNPHDPNGEFSGHAYNHWIEGWLVQDTNERFNMLRPLLTALHDAVTAAIKISSR